MSKKSNKGILLLDRDGIINRELGDYVTQPDELEVLEHAIDGIKLANKMGLKVVVITNQGGIRKGRYTLETLMNIHLKMENVIEQEGGKIDFIFFCPHHSFIENCLCRKPKHLMLQKALHKFNMRGEEAIFFGDSETDIQAGRKAGIKSILVPANTSWVKFFEGWLSN